MKPFQYHEAAIKYAWVASRLLLFEARKMILEKIFGLQTSMAVLWHLVRLFDFRGDESSSEVPKDERECH
jgi:hypothetical protein